MFNLHDAAIIISVAALCSLLYLLVMLFSYRQSLYHIWNHLSFLLFFVFTIQLALLVSFFIDPYRIDCITFNAINDGSRGATAVILLAMYSVWMFPPCMEPEKQKLWRYEVIVFASIFIWILAQVLSITLTGNFQDEHPGLCHLRIGQWSLALIFLWIPIFLNFIFSIGFIYWIKTRDLMLSRNRVNVASWILFLSCAFKTISAVAEIKDTIDLAGENFTTFEHEQQESHDGESLSTIIFVAIFFYAVHVILLSIAFVYAEDLIPQWLRAGKIRRILGCYCCCYDTSDGYYESLQQQQALSSGDGGDDENNNNHETSGYGTSSSSLNQTTGAAASSDTIPPPKKGKNNNNNNNNQYLQKNLIIEDPRQIEIDNEPNPYDARDDDAAKGAIGNIKKKKTNSGFDQQYPGQHHQQNNNNNAIMMSRSNPNSGARLNSSLIASSGGMSAASLYSMRGGGGAGGASTYELLSRNSYGRDVSHSLTYFMTMIRDDITAGVNNSAIFGKNQNNNSDGNKHNNNNNHSRTASSNVIAVTVSNFLGTTGGRTANSKDNTMTGGDGSHDGVSRPGLDGSYFHNGKLHYSTTVSSAKIQSDTSFVQRQQHSSYFPNDDDHNDDDETEESASNNHNNDSSTRSLMKTANEEDLVGSKIGNNSNNVKPGEEVV